MYDMRLVEMLMCIPEEDACLSNPWSPPGKPV